MLDRDRAAFEPTVKALGAELAEQLGPGWEPLVSQCAQAVVMRR